MRQCVKQDLNNWKLSHAEKEGLWGMLFGSNGDNSEPECPGHPWQLSSLASRLHVNSMVAVSLLDEFCDVMKYCPSGKFHCGSPALSLML